MSRSRKAAVIALGTGVGAVANLLLAAILSRELDEGDYGTYRQALLPVRTLVPILQLGLPLAIYHFLPKDGDEKGKTLTNNVALLTVAGLSWLLFTLCGGNHLVANGFNNPELAPLLIITAFICFFRISSASFVPYMAASDRSGLLASVTSAQGFLRIAAGLGAYYIWRTGESVLWAALLVALVIGATKLILMYNVGGRCLVRPRPAIMKEHLRFGVILGMASILGTLHLQMDKIFIAALTDERQYAIFVNGAQEIPFVGTLQGAVVAVLMAELARMIEARELGRASRLWRRAVRKVALISVPLGAFAMVAATDMMEVLFSAKYRVSGPIFAVYAVLVPLRSISYGAVCVAAGRNDLVLKGAAIGVLSNLVLTPVLIVLMGPIGAAVASVASIGLILIPWLFVKIGGILERPPRTLLPWGSLAGTVGCAAAMTVPVYFGEVLLAPLPAWLRLGINATVFGVGVVGLFLLFGLMNRQQLQKAIQHGFAKVRTRLKP